MATRLLVDCKVSPIFTQNTVSGVVGRFRESFSHPSENKSCPSLSLLSHISSIYATVVRFPNVAAHTQRVRFLSSHAASLTKTSRCPRGWFKPFRFLLPQL